MLTQLECPDGELTEVRSCLGHCRMQHRCLTLPTLYKLTEQRVPVFDEHGRLQLSTTALLNGTMYEYLKHMKDYSIKPESRAFALLGTKHHDSLQRWAGILNLPAEESLTEDDRNMFDLLENEGMADFSVPDTMRTAEPIWVLTDYKTWGSYKVAKTFGIVAETSGPVEYYTDRAGRRRTRTEKTFKADKDQADAFELEMQMNRYRLLMKERHNIDVARMQVQITVRDGGLQMARQRGVDKLMYLELVDFIPGADVQAYFWLKQQQMNGACTTGEPELCSPRERWDDARCKGYCEIVDHCWHGRTVREG